MIDREHFVADDFDAEEFAKSLSASCESDVELQKQRRAIQSLIDDTSHSLKKNVYKNYTQFIETSKEISYLESEMYQLSHLLTDQKKTLGAFSRLSLTDHKIQGSVAMDDLGDASDDDEKNITSVLETVEGCSHITEVPNRHCIQSGHFVEINPATQMEARFVRAYLLNDSLLIAAHIKHRRGPVKYRFQALFELDSLAVVNVADTSDIQNAFKVLMFPDTYMYQAENASAKIQWLDLIDKTKQHHKAKRDKQRKSLESLSRHDSIHRRSEAAIDAARQQAELLEADWLQDAPDDLDVFIAQRDFEGALELIEKTKTYLSGLTENHAVRDIRNRIEHRSKHLAEVLVKELRGSPVGSLRGGPRAARKAVGLLLRLGRAAQACNLFLKNRNKVMVHSQQQLKVEGSVVLYVAKLASVFFDGLLESVQEFQRAFAGNPDSSSAFVVWADEQLRVFVDQFTRQLANCKNLGTVAECVEAALKECEKLCVAGLDFTYTMHKLMLESLADSINESRDRLIEACRLKAAEETWKPMDFRTDEKLLSTLVLEMNNIGIDDFSNLVFDGGKVDLSGTTVSFCKATHSFVQEGLRLYIPELYGVFIESTSSLFQEQLIIIQDALAEDQYLQEHPFILKNATFILETMLPVVEETVQTAFGRASPELHDLHAELEYLMESGGEPSGADGGGDDDAGIAEGTVESETDSDGEVV
ncbi:exocyst complex component 8-like [Oscarella lobularis]|uniref:exocyst complex component 8-like n=1 Tax=Oscarella lobularis TaxID=121494 RepID=UPI003313F24F